MRFIDAAAIDQALDVPALVEALREAFRGGITVPTRHHHTVPRAGAADATFLLMPAWNDDPASFIGTKLVTIFPDNATRGQASVLGTYVLMEGATGRVVALLDGVALTLRRTAAASALAATYLARPDARRLLMVGAGALAPHLIAAHAAVRPIREVAIWNHRPERAEALAARLDRPGLAVRAVTDLDAEIAAADIVSAATLSTEPLVHGEALRPGTHVDLVGGFTPHMREADDAAIARARVHVDTRAGATKEAGDITQPLASGALAEGAILGDLFDLAAGRSIGRQGAGEITLFKSVGTAIEDLAAAALVYRRLAMA
ncbi:MAG: ornithine cyclodeaminase family protein [Rhizobiales bacterium]|nr:ornithine cyclodeaminase family protein [Hyphomicrobiales bacterium]